jgi:hypothetical protein
MVTNNWFTTNLSQRSSTNLCDFEIYINPYEFKPDTFNNNANRLAKKLYEEYDNLYLTYSGGIDSEFVLDTFYKLGLPITPIIMVTPYNMVESQYAFKYCNERKIRYEVLSYTKEKILTELYKKTYNRGWFAPLGGIPLIACDEVNKVGGKLLTGYGECFKSEKNDPDGQLSTLLDFCEWDYYLDEYDSSHPSGFFCYDLPLFHSMFTSISYEKSTQQAKYELYGLEPRPKMYWDDEFYYIAGQLAHINYRPDYHIQKTELLELLDSCK